MKLVLPCKDLGSWSGGNDYLRMCIAGIAAAAPSIQLTLALAEPTLRTRLRHRVGGTARGMLSLLRTGVFNSKRIPMPTLEEFQNVLHVDGVQCDFVRYLDSPKALLKTLVDRAPCAIFPVTQTLGPDFPIPWVAYIPDFQHRHLPEFFSTKERSGRDGLFADIIRDASVFALNSRAVAEDLHHFYPQARCRTFVLPFAPIPAPAWLEPEASGLLDHYLLPPRFFLISNQFWIHKSHITAFEALRILTSQPAYRDIELLCTGTTHDYRYPHYFKELMQKVESMGMSSRVRILGRIPKNEQIAVMKRALAVVQPTLFEGGPGGGSVYDAVAVGTRVIASDISVNREIERDSVRFFRSQSPESLAEEMQRAIDTPYERPAPEFLREQGRIALQKFGSRILEAILAAS